MKFLWTQYGPCLQNLPNYEKFTEAKELLQRKAAFAISDATMFNETMLLLMQSPAREKGSVAAIKYVEEHTGATQKILQSVRFNS